MVEIRKTDHFVQWLDDLVDIQARARVQIRNAFNLAINAGKTAESDKESFEAKFATALYLAKKER